ncbi:MAG: hypothetical protein AMXMBFR47_40530 [Planctomycetota bacterium]
MANLARWHARRSAMTLIELLAIVAAIVLLALLIVPQFVGSRSVNRLDYTRSAITSTDNDLERFKLDTGRYPSRLSDLITRPADPIIAARWQGPYVRRLPVDEWGTPLGYACPGGNNPQTFDLWSFGPDRVSGSADDITNWD